MLLKIGTDRSFSSSFENAGLLSVIYRNLPRGTIVITGPKLLFEYGIDIPPDKYTAHDTAHGTGIIHEIGMVRQINEASFNYILSSDTSSEKKGEPIGNFNAEIFTNSTFKKGEKELLHWAQSIEPGVIKVIFTNDDKTCRDAYNKRILVFRNGTILYAGVLLKWWKEEKAKDIYNKIWAANPQSIPPDCETWSSFKKNYEILLPKNSKILIDILSECSK